MPAKPIPNDPTFGGLLEQRAYVPARKKREKWPC